MDAQAILDAFNEMQPAADMPSPPPSPRSSCARFSMPPRRGHERRDHCRRRPLVYRPAYVLRTPSLFALALRSRSYARAPSTPCGSSMLAADMAPGGGNPGSRGTASVALLVPGRRLRACVSVCEGKRRVT
jgi:hypothetical protein